MRSLAPVPQLFMHATAAVLVLISPGVVARPSSHGPNLLSRDADEHHMHGAPLKEYNETLQLTTHSPTPPSYWTLDFGDATDLDGSGHPRLMVLHVLLMSVAFFGLLPMAIALRSTRSAWHGAAVAAFWAAVVLGVSAGGLYTKMTPDMYAGSTHAKTGYITLLAALAPSAVDILALARRALAFARTGAKPSLSALWRTVVLARTEAAPPSVAEYTHILSPDAEADEESIELQNAELPPGKDVDDHPAAQWANRVWPQTASSDRTVFGHHSPSASRHSEETLHDFIQAPRRRSTQTRVAAGVLATAERALVFAALVTTLSGLSVYTGMCRANYINGCLAHLIKGSIFWCYGLVTFARFLGSFSDLGWAWNVPPTHQSVTAEFVESFVIFLYGATNTWMERFGAEPGSPFTTKQVQHISIAVMFWFAGIVGMAIESKRFRRWLASTAASAARKGADAVAEPHTYVASFNPFPALVIGVTGAAMSAHAQTYVFQVQIHALWGFLLCAFSVMRCLTYCFVWVSPPRSILPSRPPTEALAGFFLACGGLMFVLSDEEITIAAMRSGHSDQMMFLNLAVAITCLAMCWVLAVVGFKAWLKSRQHYVSFISS